MSPIVRDGVRLLAGAVLTFACYAMTHGHLLPGGGIAGGMLAATAFAMLVLAFGAADGAAGLGKSWRTFAPLGLLLLLLAAAALRLRSGAFFAQRAVPTVGDGASLLPGGGEALLSDLTLGLTVWAGALAGLMALASFRTGDGGGPE